MAKIIANALTTEDYPADLISYSAALRDYSSLSPNIQEHLLKAYYKGIIRGYPDGAFKAENSATRAEAVDARMSLVLRNNTITGNSSNTRRRYPPSFRRGRELHC